MKSATPPGETKGSYVSPLRAAQAAATRQQILDALGVLIERGEEPTFASIAREAGVQERTVYRHFPSKDELYEAFWWSVLDARLGRTGYDAASADDLQRDVDATFHGFEQHANLVIEMLHSKHGLEIRLRTNDRRRAMFERVARAELPDADEQTIRRAAAAAQVLYSGSAWHDLRDYWDMDADESAAAISLAIEALFAGLRSSTARPPRPKDRGTTPAQQPRR
jgi:AcrR family transcriptional regulator